MTVDIPIALKNLAQTLTKLKELTEWAKIEQMGFQPCVPLSFQLTCHAREEFRQQHERFLQGYFEVQEALNDPCLVATRSDRHKWQECLKEMQRELQSLSHTERFISV